MLLLCVLSGCTQLNPDYDPGSLGDLGGAAATDGHAPVDLAGVDLAGQDLAVDPRDLASQPDLLFPVPDLHQPGGSCTSRFGGQPDFMSCAETATSCRFYVRNAEKASCEAVCATVFSSVCLSAWDVDTLTCSTAGVAQVPCTAPHHDKICECTNL